MKRFIILSLLIAACTSNSDYRVSNHLTAQQQDQIMERVIRYLAKPPEGLTFSERFYAGYQPYYDEQKKRHKIDAYYIDENQTHYFLISRSAPSIVEKRVATGGKVTFSSTNQVETYEEVFRTWKMVPDTLTKRSLLLFDLMVKGKALTAYETKNSNGIEYIEFPDDRTYFDTSLKQWQVRN